MITPRISLIINTARLGSFDMLLDSIRWQTAFLPDEFELIIVDEYFDERRQALKLLDYSVEFPPIVHVPPKQTGVSYHVSASFNTGLALAQGELVVFLVDFVWLPADFLDRHWRFYKEHPGYSLSVYVDRYKYPPITQPTQPLAIFDKWFNDEYAVEWFKDENIIYRERKGGILGPQIMPDIFEMPGDRIYMLGDSIPLAVMKELGGWDQIFDGGYGAADICLGIQANLAGWKFAVDMTAPTLKKLGERSMAHLLPTIPTTYLRTPGENYAIFEQRIRAIKDGRESLRVPKGRGAWE